MQGHYRKYWMKEARSYFQERAVLAGGVPAQCADGYRIIVKRVIETLKLTDILA
jgi:hypothetical protein